MSDDSPKIYLLPNLMTAGNLFCGFAATLRILEGALIQASGNVAAVEHSAILFHQAILFILGACIFDLLDGRVARFGGNESPFGREFDSLADIVSFGVAPALMVYRIVLQDFRNLGWMVAFVYLVCGALRLARFNCIAASSNSGGGSEFKGFPIPAAAGLTASLTLFILWLAEDGRTIGNWRWLLLCLMLFLSFMMFSRFKYPSFKSVDWRTKRSIPRFLVICLVLAMTVKYYEWMPALIFISYLLYGFFRPWLSLKWRREIEEEEDEAELPSANSPK
jgi:CDP-diacylglycerol---serine O-phosphatidyltransferase